MRPMTEKDRMAQSLLYAATAQDVRARETYGHDDAMRAMVFGDANDMRDIAALIVKGKIKEAYNAARSMDTGARDYIPDEVYRFMVASGLPQKETDKQRAI